MDETTIPKPLAGPEIIEAVVFKIRENLNKNCLLAPHAAYGAFSFDAKVTITFVNPTSMVKEALGFASGTGGEPQDVVESSTEVIDIHEDAAPPNAVRRDTGQGIPVRVKTPQGGVEERKLKYERKDANAAGSGREADSGKGRKKSA